MSFRQWLWSAAALLASVAPASAQAPSPLELVQGIREAGMPDLALEYLKEIEASLSPADKATVPLERAKCLLDAADDEPDEGTRASMVGEAKEGFTTFQVSNPKHPRVSEASLALARLASIDAKAQLNRSRRMEVPSEGDPGREAAVTKQKEEFKKSRPMFLNASTQFANAAKQIEEKLAEPGLDPVVKQNLAREKFDADLAAAINQHNLAETFLAAGAAELEDRTKALEKAFDMFEKLAKGPVANRTIWIAKAWMGEVLEDQGKPNDAATAFTAIMISQRFEAEDGKRLVRFFQIRRKYGIALTGGNLADLEKVAGELRVWLARYGTGRKPTPEVLAGKYYLAYTLQQQAIVAMGPPPKTGPAPKPSETALKYLAESEKLYRTLAQTDHDYTIRAGRNRMFVVRKLLGEADRAPNSYATFEETQMASLIQMAKLNDAEKALAGGSLVDETTPFWARLYAETGPARLSTEVKERKARVIALLEHAREIATDKDTTADVNDNMLRLVFFYQSNDQPFQAAVLGEHISRTIKSTGGKGAIAGVMALNGYTLAGKGKEVWEPVKISETFAIARSFLKPTPPPAPKEGDPKPAATAEPYCPAWAAIFWSLPEVLPDAAAKIVTATTAATKKSDRERAMRIARFLDDTFPNDTPTDFARYRLASMLAEEGKPHAAFQVIVKIRPGYSSVTVARQYEGYLAAVLIAKDKDEEGEPELALTPEQKLVVFRKAADDLRRFPKPVAAGSKEDVRGYLTLRVRLAQLYLSQSKADPATDATSPGYLVSLAIAEETLAALRDFDVLKEKDKDNKYKLTGSYLEGLNTDGAELRLQALDVRTRALFLRVKSLVDTKKLDDANVAIEPAVADADKDGLIVTERIKQWLGGEGDKDAKGELVDTAEVAAQKAKIAGLATGIDKLRRDIVLLGFKLRCVQGRPADATKMLDLLKKNGGGIEVNQSGFESLARELAAQIQALHRAGQAKQATDLGAGLALLLKEFANLKPEQITTSTTLFLGATSLTVGEFENALKEFAKIAVPVVPAGIGPKGVEWWNLDTKLIPDMDRNKYQDSVKYYRFAQLNTARALIGLKRFDEAEKLLAKAIGGQAKEPQGFAFGSLDYRKELAGLYEVKGAALAGKPAGDAWGLALKEWTTLVGFASNNVKRVADAKGTPAQVMQAKSGYYDAYYEVQRVLLAANTQLLQKGTPKLADTFKAVGKRIADLETSGKFNDMTIDDPKNPGKKLSAGRELVTNEVWTHYCDLLDKYPELKAAYKESNGKFFNDRPKVD